ncbi:hypothetical protein NliqN6_1504 [Naganishia liquefaciens]|uniref:Trafficking protein particle complex subunit BET3 n=1 Tax=Naganishia liquefaciens TaxID=104408 RepID=A0A8H3TQ14_9TREE|nr:hypothetical protein NliqN6_1504 [Naganishia liquefaciens]
MSQQQQQQQQQARQYKAIGEDLWKNRTEKVNAELFSFTYGALVVQLIKDYEDYAEVNNQLEKMGYNMGTRLIEDFLARTSLPRCADFRETAEVISKVGFKTFLNITPSVTFPSTTTSTTTTNTTTTTTTDIPGMTGPTEFILTFDENPLAEFAELPLDAMGPKYAKAAQEKKLSNWDAKEVRGQAEGLWFSNILCGVVRGSLEMLQMQVEASFLSDRLRGDDSTDIHVKLIRIMEEEQPINDE